MKSVRIKNYLILVLLSFSVANFCFAALLQPGTQSTIGNKAIKAADSGYDVSGASTLLSLAQIVINAFLSLVGVILLVYLLHAGYKWMTAHGEEEKVTEAKDTIKRAIIGVIIIVAAYAISVFVMARLEAGTLRGGASTPASPAAPATIPATPPPPDLPPVYDDE